MTSETPLRVDTQHMAEFVREMFRHAPAGGWVSLRAFRDDVEGPPFAIKSVRLDDDRRRKALIGAAIALANRAASAPHPVVFCPPIAVFAVKDSAKQIDLMAGLALSVELDAHPAKSAAEIEAILGTPTCTVESGGLCVDPETGETEPKRHVHYVLSKPTLTAEDHARLRRARDLATTLIGGDPTNKSIVHPIRWPGSWHRKRVPRPCRIVQGCRSAEINLDDALAALERVAAERGVVTATRASTAPGEHAAVGGEARGIAALVAAILSGAEYHAPLVSLSARLIGSGMSARQAVPLLQGIMLSVPEGLRDMKDGAPAPGRWQARFDDIERSVEGARGAFAAKRRFSGDAAIPAADIIGGDRADQIRQTARKLLKAAWSVEPGTSSDLVHSFNLIRCAPPLSPTEVQAIIEAEAARAVKQRRSRRHG